MSNKVGVALLKYICPICGKVNEDASTIAINSVLTEKEAKKVEDMHNQVVGYSDKPCKECQEWIDKGAFFVIGIDPEKTDDNSNPYRTGHLVGIKKESEFYKHLPDEYKIIDAMYMDYREMKQIGMIK